MTCLAYLTAAIAAILFMRTRMEAERREREETQANDRDSRMTEQHDGARPSHTFTEED